MRRGKMEFIVKVKKWGKSLRFILPKYAVDMLGIKENSTVRFEINKAGSQFRISGIRVLE